MGLEVATTIDQLVPTNPLGTDNRSQGDDHVRLIKSALKNTFPNFTGPVNLTSESINGMVSCFPGMIVMWSGTTTSIPTGWKLCNGVGTISNGNPVPNLSGRFVFGSTTDSGGTYNIGATGGAVASGFNFTSQYTALSVGQLPAHTHTGVGYNRSAGGGGYPGFDGAGDAYAATPSDPAGSGEGHAHQIIGSVSILPPFLALAYLIKN